MVTLNRNGRYWQARWVDPVTGRTVRRGIGPRAQISHRQAVALCKVIADEVAATALASLEPEAPQADAPPASPTVAEWRDRWLGQQVGLMESTMRMHRRYWRMIVEQLGSGTRLDDVTPDMVIDARIRMGDRADLLHGPGTLRRAKAETTMARMCRNARKYWHDAVAAGLARRNPWTAVRTTAPEIQVPRRVLSDADAERIVACCKPGVALLVALCHWAGLRRHEAMGLRWEHVDFERNRIVVWPKTHVVTSKHKHREVRLEPRLAEILRAAPRTADNVVGRVTEARAWLDLRAAALKAGVTGEVSFQLMRSSRENHWFAAGYPANVVTAWMGHSPQVAAKHYRGVAEQYYDAAPQGQAPGSQATELAALRAQLAALQALILGKAG
jgi:integrase